MKLSCGLVFKSGKDKGMDITLRELGIAGILHRLDVKYPTLFKSRVKYNLPGLFVTDLTCSPQV